MMLTKPTSIGVLALVATLGLAAPARGEQDSQSVTGRFKVEAHEVCLKVDVYLTNTTEKELTIVTGSGGVARSVAPELSSGGARLTPANWRGWPRRSMRPDPLKLPPGEEILYDTYLVPHPPGEQIEGLISFAALDQRDLWYTIEFQPQPNPAWPKAEPAGLPPTRE